MLSDYKVGRCSRQCYAEKRPLKEGEWYYSVLIEAENELERRDYSAGAWQSPPDGTVGYWKCRMPLAGKTKVVLAPREVLIDLLRQMESDPDQAKTRYLLALMLLRRRYLKLDGTDVESSEESDSTKETTWMNLTVVGDGSQIRVATCEVSASETETLSESLNDLLYCEASEVEQE